MNTTPLTDYRRRNPVWPALVFVQFLLLAKMLTAAEIGPSRLGSSSTQPPRTGGGNSFAPIFSGDGRFLVFLSEANNLVTNDDHTPYLDVFVRDLVTGTTTLASGDASGIGGGSGNSSQPSISSDAKVLAFVTAPGDGLPSSPTNVSEVYVRNMTDGATILARTNNAGASAGPRGSSYPLVSADGHYVVFSAANPRTNGINSTADVFRRDLQSGVITLVSLSSNGVSASSTYTYPTSISADASKVAFSSDSTNLAPNTSTYYSDIYVRDLNRQETIWVSAAVSNAFPGRYWCDEAVLSESGSHVVFYATAQSFPTSLFRYDLQSGQLTQVTGQFSASYWPSISADGRYVAYSDGTNAYVWDGNNASNTLVNVSLSGTDSATGRSYAPTFNSDASKVVFLSNSTNLSAQETHGKVQVFVRDLVSGVISLASVGLDATGITNSDLSNILPAISPDGSHVAFDTADANLVAGDNNRASDVFVRSLSSGITKLISERAPNLPSLSGSGLSTVFRNCLSADRRFLLFKSFSPDIVAGVTNDLPCVFLRDLITGSNGLISATATELGGTNINITGWEISADGRFAAFSQRYWPSGASGPQEEVFRRDLLGGSLSLVSRTTNGTKSGGSTAPSISADGRWVAFQSASAGLITNAYGVGLNIFLRDMVSEQTMLVSVSASGAPADGSSWGPHVSPEGRLVVFLSSNRALVSPSPPSFLLTMVYARDMISNRTYMACVSASGQALSGTASELGLTGNGRALVYRLFSSTFDGYLYDLVTHSNRLVCSDCRSLSASRDGRRVVYEQPSSGTVPHQIGWKDLLTGVTNIASANNAGELANGTCSAPVVTPDGRYVVFLSTANNLTTAGGNGLPNLYLRDLVQSNTMLLTPSLSGNGPGNATAGPPILAADGQTIIFHSLASDLVARDFNNDRDVFLLRLGGSDSDGDGMDDDWEVAFFGDLSRDGSGDFDQDGQSDLAEFLAGTDPTNGNSIFRALTVESPGTSLTRVLWSAVPGKTYQVQYKTNLNNAAWLNLSSPSTAASSTGSMMDTSAAQSTRCFYRVLLVQ